MSEFGSNISGSTGGGIATTAPSMGMENSSAFSSRGLSNFKSPSSSEESMISLDHGKESNPSFARSESFENSVASNKPIFDISRPIAQDAIENHEETSHKIGSHEEQLTSLFGEKMDYKSNDLSYNTTGNFSEHLTNSKVIWESPNSKLGKSNKIDTPKEEPTPIKEHKKVMEPGVSQEIEQNNTSVNGNNAVENESLNINDINNKVVKNSDLELGVVGQNNTESNKSLTEVPQQLHESQDVDTFVEKPATLPEVQKQPKTEHKAQNQPNVKTEETLKSVREELRLMPDNGEITVTLPEIQTIATAEMVMPKVMDIATFEEMVRTSAQPEVQTKTQVDTKTEARTITKTRKETSSENETDSLVETENVQKLKIEPAVFEEHEKEEEDVKEEEVPERKVTIKKAWFEKDVTANENRKFEIFKAYAIVHYKWAKQYITKMEGSSVARTIQGTRNREKLESMSIKRIDIDGSVDPFAETIASITELDTPTVLEEIIEVAEEEFSATNFTSHPSNEIVDGEQISYVHNNEEEFIANLDGEEVMVLMNGAKYMKKPEFIRVERE